MASRSTATIDLVAKDSRFQSAMKRVDSVMKRIRKRMQAVSQSARRMLLVGGAAIAGFLKLAANQIREEVKLEAVLKATGNAAGFTAEQLKKQASALQTLTGVGDEAIIGMQAILATFRQIKGDEFERVTKVALDMSAVLGQDAKSAAIQLGKALNDPIKGLTALSRSGVTFSKEQENVIKSLVKSGRLMEAQGKILDELENQFGGAAEAIGKSFVGSMKKAFAALGDVGEKIGDVFIPIVKALADQVTPVLERVGEWIKHNQKLVLAITAVVAAVTTVVAVVTPFLALLGLLPILLAGITTAVGALTVAFAFLAANPIVLAIAATVLGLGFLIAKFALAKDKVEEFNAETTKIKPFDSASITGTPIEKNQKIVIGLMQVKEKLVAELEEIERELKKERGLHDPMPFELMDRFDEVSLRIKNTGIEIENTKRKLTELTILERQEAVALTASIALLEQQKIAREAVGETIQKITNEIRVLNAGNEEEQNALREKIRLEQELSRLLAAGAEVTQLIKVIDAQKELNTLKKEQAAAKIAQKEEDALKAQAERIREIIKTDKERLIEELKLVAVLEQAGKLTADEAIRRIATLSKSDNKPSIAGQVEGLTSTFRRIQEAAASREPLNVAKATHRGIITLNNVVTVIKDTILDARREGRRVAVFGE